ncbi:MAG: DUF4166 domain-containing protein [Fimbriimonas sp.]
MNSIYQRVLGSDFDRLHPKIQERFGFSADDGIAHIGRGVMDEVWHGAAFTLPFLAIGAGRNCLFPERGRDVPFTIRNYAYRDALGRETVTWVRDFQTRRSRRFDAYMILSETRGKIVDYLGNHQHLAVDLDLSVTEEGALRIVSGEQRFYEGPLGFRFPMFFSGFAEVTEGYDDETGRFHISVDVKNRTWGPLFGYRGTFDVEALHGVPVPEEILPRRVERRE